MDSAYKKRVMTEEQIKALVLSEARGNQTGFTSDFEADARNALPRLLEERKRLLEVVRGIEQHIRLSLNDGGAPVEGCKHDGKEGFGGECIGWAAKKARVAIAFAEEAAP